MKFEKTREHSKNDLPVSRTPAIPDSPVSRTPAFCISPVAWTTAILSAVNWLQIPGILDTGIRHFTGIQDTGDLNKTVKPMNHRCPGHWQLEISLCPGHREFAIRWCPERRGIILKLH